MGGSPSERARGLGLGSGAFPCKQLARQQSAAGSSWEEAKFDNTVGQQPGWRQVVATTMGSNCLFCQLVARQMCETQQKNKQWENQQAEQEFPDEHHGTSVNFCWNIFSEEVWSCCMLDLVLAIKVSISPGKQFDVRWAVFLKAFVIHTPRFSVAQCVG